MSAALYVVLFACAFAPLLTTYLAIRTVRGARAELARIAAAPPALVGAEVIHAVAERHARALHADLARRLRPGRFDPMRPNRRRPGDGGEPN